MLYLSVTEDPMNAHGNCSIWMTVGSFTTFLPKILIVFWQYFAASSSPDDYSLITAFVIQSARQLQHSRLPEWKYYIRWLKNKCSINTIHELFFLNGINIIMTLGFTYFSWMTPACLWSVTKKENNTNTDKLLCFQWDQQSPIIESDKQNKVSKLNWQLGICCHLNKKKSLKPGY